VTPEKRKRRKEKIKSVKRLQENHFKCKDTDKLKVERWRKHAMLIQIKSKLE
jgi:hypothetical protein